MKNELKKKISKHSNKESKIPGVQRVNSHGIFIELGDNCIKNFIWGGISLDIRSEI